MKMNLYSADDRLPQKSLALIKLILLEHDVFGSDIDMSFGSSQSYFFKIILLLNKAKKLDIEEIVLDRTYIAVAFGENEKELAQPQYVATSLGGAKRERLINENAVMQKLLEMKLTVIGGEWAKKHDLSCLDLGCFKSIRFAVSQGKLKWFKNMFAENVAAFKEGALYGSNEEGRNYDWHMDRLKAVIDSKVSDGRPKKNLLLNRTDFLIDFYFPEAVFAAEIDGNLKIVKCGFHEPDQHTTIEGLLERQRRYQLSPHLLNGKGGVWLKVDVSKVESKKVIPNTQAKLQAVENPLGSQKSDESSGLTFNNMTISLRDVTGKSGFDVKIGDEELPYETLLSDDRRVLRAFIAFLSLGGLYQFSSRSQFCSKYNESSKGGKKLSNKSCGSLFSKMKNFMKKKKIIGAVDEPDGRPTLSSQK